MFYFDKEFIPLGILASHLNLPASYLKELAGKNLIPSLDVKGRQRFNLLAVEKALANLAATEHEGKSTVLGSERASQ